MKYNPDRGYTRRREVWHLFCRLNCGKTRTRRVTSFACFHWLQFFLFLSLYFLFFPSFIPLPFPYFYFLGLFVSSSVSNSSPLAILSRSFLPNSSISSLFFHPNNARMRMHGSKITLKHSESGTHAGTFFFPLYSFFTIYFNWLRQGGGKKKETERH